MGRVCLIASSIGLILIHFSVYNGLFLRSSPCFVPYFVFVLQNAAFPIASTRVALGKALHIGFSVRYGAARQTRTSPIMASGTQDVSEPWWSLKACPLVRPPVRPSVRTSVRPSARPSVRPSARPSARPPVSEFVWSYFGRIFVYQFCAQI